MNRDTTYAFLAALFVHVALLFGVRPDLDGGEFMPPEIAAEVEVTLVLAGPPEAAEAEPPPSVTATEEIEPPEPEPEPPPEPEPSEPEPIEAEPEPEPEVEEPPLIEEPEIAHVEEAVPPEPMPEPLPAREREPVQVESPLPPVVEAGEPPQPERPEVVVRTELDYRRQIEPEYPMLARRQKQEGEVILMLHIDERGRVRDVDVKQSSGHPLLDRAAMNAARRSLFHPARVGNRAVPSVAEQPYRFFLRE